MPARPSGSGPCQAVAGHFEVDCRPTLGATHVATGMPALVEQIELRTAPASTRPPPGSSSRKRLPGTDERPSRSVSEGHKAAALGNLLPAWARLGPISVEVSFWVPATQTVHRDASCRDGHPTGWLSGFPTGRPWVLASGVSARRRAKLARVRLRHSRTRS
jgi:hypothetical protein